MIPEIVTVERLNGADTIDAARCYLKQGWKVHPVPRTGNHKAPIAKNWPTHDFTLQEFEERQNIGVRLGEEVAKGRFLCDVDLDMKAADGEPFPGASEVVDELLPRGAVVFGRSSSPRAHRLYLATAPIETAQYHGLRDGMLIELRGRSKKGTPHQTVIPPGVHESGESIRFVEFGPLTIVDADGLRDGVRYAAVGLAILQIWPERGKRHQARLAFSKVLREVGLPDDVARAVLVAVNRATGSDVGDVASCFAATAAKDAKETVGASWVVEHLDGGEATLRVIDKILGRKASLPAGSFDVTNMDLKTLTPLVWARLQEHNDPARRLLQGGLPVRVTHIPTNGDERRPTWVFQGLDVDRLRHETAQVAAFVRGSKGAREVAPPRELVADMLACEPRRIPLPVVTRIVYAPTMARDGSIQLAPGYQAATGTFYVDTGLRIPPIADAPTDEDLARAVATIDEPLRDFAFVEEADRAAAIAFMLLPFVRGLIDGPTPLHLFKKPVAGAGATLLTDTLLHPSVGTDIARLSTVGDDDEWRKQITATLLDGPSVVLIDNARELVSPQLAKAITDDVWQARILGVSRNAVLRVDCAWGATGINPDLHQELARRVVPCRLDPQVERPWLREGFAIPDLRAWSRAHRGDMVWAALTLARAWHVVGRPAGERSLGMFEDWARVVGGILRHAGFGGFLANLEELYEEADVEGDAVAWLCEQWHVHHRDQPVRLADAALWALAEGSPILGLLASSSDKGRHMEFSKWVRRLRRRIVAVHGRPMRIEPVKANGPSQRHTWRLAAAGARAAADAELPLVVEEAREPETDADPAM